MDLTATSVHLYRDVRRFPIRNVCIVDKLRALVMLINGKMEERVVDIMLIFRWDKNYFVELRIFVPPFDFLSCRNTTYF